MKHTELSRGSVLSAIKDGAKSLSQIAKMHGYGTPVSGGVTAKIRKLVPEVAERLAGTYVEQKPVVSVAQSKSPYRGKVYGPVFAEAVSAGEVEVDAFVKVAATKLALPEQSVFFAVEIMRMPQHRSNKFRSKDISEKRGSMHLVPVKEGEVA